MHIINKNCLRKQKRNKVNNKNIYEKNGEKKNLIENIDEKI